MGSCRRQMVLPPLPRRHVGGKKEKLRHGLIALGQGNPFGVRVAQGLAVLAVGDDAVREVRHPLVVRLVAGWVPYLARLLDWAVVVHPVFGLMLLLLEVRDPAVGEDVIGGEPDAFGIRWHVVVEVAVIGGGDGACAVVGARVVAYQHGAIALEPVFALVFHIDHAVEAGALVLAGDAQGTVGPVDGDRSSAGVSFAPHAELGAWKLGLESLPQDPGRFGGPDAAGSVSPYTRSGQSSAVMSQKRHSDDWLPTRACRNLGTARARCCSGRRRGLLAAAMLYGFWSCLSSASSSWTRASALTRASRSASARSCWFS